MHPSDEAVLTRNAAPVLRARRPRAWRRRAGHAAGDEAALGRPRSKRMAACRACRTFAPKAKRAIYLHMVGAPPQMDLYDYKPVMKDWFDKDLPESIRKGQRLTTMTSGQSRFPIAPSVFKFSQHGQSGAWISELLPYTAKMVDDIAIIRIDAHRSDQSRAGDHVHPDRLYDRRQAVHRRVDRLRLGSMNQDLPTFVVLNATHSHPKANVQAISAQAVERGFPFRASMPAWRCDPGGDPVLYINNPDGVRRPGAPPHAGCAERDEPDAVRRGGRSGDAGAHRAVRDGVSHADVGAGADRSFEGAGEHVTSSTARMRERPARSPIPA